MTGCIFCKIVRKEIPSAIVHEDARVIALMDIACVNPGHVLVVPKAHAENLFAVDEIDASAAMAVAVRISRAIRDIFTPDGLSVYQANGVVAGQQVFHFHVHLIPRYQGDAMTLNLPRQSPSHEQLQRQAAKIRAQLL